MRTRQKVGLAVRSETLKTMKVNSGVLSVMAPSSLLACVKVLAKANFSVFWVKVPKCMTGSPSHFVVKLVSCLFSSQAINSTTHLLTVVMSRR